MAERARPASAASRSTIRSSRLLGCTKFLAEQRNQPLGLLLLNLYRGAHWMIDVKALSNFLRTHSISQVLGNSFPLNAKSMQMTTVVFVSGITCSYQTVGIRALNDTPAYGSKT